MKKVFSLVLMVVMVFALAGCSGKNNSSESDSSGTKTTESKSEADEKEIKYVGVCFPQLDNPWFVDVKDQIVGVLEEAGCEVKVESSDNNQARQIEIVENFGTKGVDGLILFPIGASEIGGTLESLQKQGVRVVTFINQVDKGSDVMLLTNNLDMGTMTAEAAAEWIDKTFPDAEPGSIEVGMLSVRTSPEANDVCEGMGKITEFTDKAKIVAEYEASFDNVQVKAQENTEAMFVDHPDVKVILTYNHPLVVDEVVMRTAGVNPEEFAIFSNTYDIPVVERMATLTPENKSVIRGISSAGYQGSWTYVADAMLGRMEAGDEGIIWDPLFLVTAENAKEYLE